MTELPGERGEPFTPENPLLLKLKESPYEPLHDEKTNVPPISEGLQGLFPLCIIYQVSPGRRPRRSRQSWREKAMRLNIAIDGPVGAGKSTVADAVADKLGILHLDTGAMYRALGLKALREHLDPDHEKEITDLCRGLNLEVRYGPDGQHTILDGEDVSALIRTPEVSMTASRVSRYAEVRREMVSLQQKLAADTDMVLDGRDICTTVLPDAPVKIYLTASAEERARRRWEEMKAKGRTESFDQVLEEVCRRDEQDMNRPVEPLRQAEDAVLVDTTHLSFEEAVDRILALAEEKRHG